jgi:hypothetical protein
MSLPKTVGASILLLIFGLIFFNIALWVIYNVGTYFYGTGNRTVDPDWATFSAALLAIGSILAGALYGKR